MVRHPVEDTGIHIYKEVQAKKATLKLTFTAIMNSSVLLPRPTVLMTFLKRQGGCQKCHTTQVKVISNLKALERQEIGHTWLH